jgi:hypothetical protein
VNLDIASRPEGGFRAAIASRDFGAFYSMTRTVDFSAGSVRIEWKGVGGAFVGDLKKGKLSGTFYLGRTSYPVVFERNAPLAK